MNSKASFIHNLFSRIADRYDFINDLMTGFLHRQWKKTLVKHAAKAVLHADSRALDLCTGTGDIADLWIDHPLISEVIAIDTCAPMLEVGYRKLQKKYLGKPPKLQMIEADALELPFPHDHFDVVTVGFGLRNVKDPDQSIKEVFRVLKPGGIFACLDLGHPPIPLIDWFFKKAFLKLIPLLGSQIAKDRAAYEYLVNSLQTWPSQRQLAKALYDFGFKRCYYQDLLLGSIAIVVAEK